MTNIATNIVPGAGGVSFNGLGNMTYDVSSNTFDFSNGGNGIQSIGVNVFKGSGSTGNFSGTIIGNTIGVSGVARSGSGPAASALNLDSQGTGISTVLIQGNTVFHYDEAGIRLNNVDGSSTLNAVVVGNTVAEPDPGAFAGLFVVAGADPTTDAGQVTNLQLGGGGANQNDFSAGDPNDLNDVFLQNGAGALNLSQGNSAALTVTQVFDDNNTPPDTTLATTDPGPPAIVVESADTVRLFRRSRSGEASLHRSTARSAASSVPAARRRIRRRPAKPGWRTRWVPSMRIPGHKANRHPDSVCLPPIQSTL